MPTVLLVRHGRTTANASGLLAGRADGVALDAVGRDQAARAAERVAGVPLARVVTSPLERCRQTARAVLDHQADDPESLTEHGITECDYGQGEGRGLEAVARGPLWGAPRAPPGRGRAVR